MVRLGGAGGNARSSAGGDRHGCTASGALNLTQAETFCEFVDEIRTAQSSHVLFMPQYTEPVSVRTTRTLLDVIRNYPENPVGSQRWDERIFHPAANGGPDTTDLHAVESTANVCGANPVAYRIARERDCAARDGTRFQARRAFRICRERLRPKLLWQSPSLPRLFRPRRYREEGQVYGSRSFHASTMRWTAWPRPAVSLRRSPDDMSCRS